MIKYVFNEDIPVFLKAAKEADAQTIGEALEKIRQEHDGNLKPQDVVAAARNKKHPLHKHFEWDDATAANGYRRMQARGIIRITRQVDASSPKGTSRAFLSINAEEHRSYRALNEVKGSNTLMEAVLNAALKDLKAFEDRYGELIDICDMVKAAREKTEKMRAEIRVQ